MSWTIWPAFRRSDKERKGTNMRNGFKSSHWCDADNNPHGRMHKRTRVYHLVAEWASGEGTGSGGA